MLTIQRDTSQERKVMSDQGISKKFFLRHKVEQRFKGKADNGNIGPVLMLRENNQQAREQENLLSSRSQSGKTWGKRYE